MMLYVSLDGLYGAGTQGFADYQSLHDLLTDLDRLGVWASVVSNVMGRDMSQLYGNQQLMSDIEKEPKAASRIIPAFVAAPSTPYVPDEMSFLESHLKSGRVGVLSLFPVSTRFALREMKHLLSCVLKYKPIILLSAFDMRPADFADLEQIANRFPELQFIVRHVMWPQYSQMIDLLRHCANVRISLSHLHIRGAIDFLARHIGSEKVIFGLGHPVLNGAAMASLQYASVTTAVKQAIAGETFLALMPNREQADQVRQAAHHLPGQIKNVLWQPFLAGQGVRDIQIIDAHVHMGPLMGVWFQPVATVERQKAELLEDSRRFGVSKWVYSSSAALFGDPVMGNRMVAEQTRDHPEIFLPYYVYNPHYADQMLLSDLEASFQAIPYIGFKLLPDYWQVNINDPVYTPVWTFASHYRLPVLIHSWEGQYDAPNLVAQVAAEYPNVSFILGHAGGGTQGRLQAIKAAQTYKNIYLEFCGSFKATLRWEETLRQVDPEQVVYGTDTYTHDVAWELGRLLSADIDEQILRKILSENYQRILMKRVSP